MGKGPSQGMTALIDTRDSYRGLFDIYWPIGVGVGLLFWVLIVSFAIAFRRRSAGRPVDFHENNKLEGAYVALLACVCAALVYFTFHWLSNDYADEPGESSSVGQHDTNAPIPGPILARINVVSSRWNWRFVYPKYGITQTGNGTLIPTLVVPEGNVTFHLTSRDVIHSFFIPYQRFKRDAFPRRFTNFTLGFHDLGFHQGAGECAEYCGYRHAYMQFNVQVLPQAAFRKWAAARQAGKPQQVTPAMNDHGEYR